jgi:hypothetical protein
MIYSDRNKLMICTILALFILILAVNEGSAAPGESPNLVPGSQNTPKPNGPVIATPSVVKSESELVWRPSIARTFISTAAQPSGFMTLLFGEELLSQKRNQARRNLRNSLGGAMPLSIEWWEDSVCNAKIPHSGGGMAFAVSNDEIIMAAYIAGERQKFISFQEDSTTGDVSSKEEYIYKISVRVINSDDTNKTLAFNLWLDDLPVFEREAILADGQTFSRVDSNLVIRQSDRLHEVVCIKFVGRPLVIREGARYKDVSQLCNRIVDISGTSTIYTLPTPIDSTIPSPPYTVSSPLPTPIDPPIPPSYTGPSLPFAG